MINMDFESQKRNEVYSPLLRRNEIPSYESIYDRPLPCCGCGIGWFSFLTGFLIPLTWYYGTYLFFTNNYRRDPRERPGLAACAIAELGLVELWLLLVEFINFIQALVITVAAVVTVISLLAGNAR